MTTDRWIVCFCDDDEHPPREHAMVVDHGRVVPAWRTSRDDAYADLETTGCGHVILWPAERAAHEQAADDGRLPVTLAGITLLTAALVLAAWWAVQTVIPDGRVIVAVVLAGLGLWLMAAVERGQR